MTAQISTVMLDVLYWMKLVVNALFSTNGDLNLLAPFFYIGVSCSALLLGVRVVKSLVWGS